MRVRWFDPAQAKFTTDEVVECRATLPVAAPSAGTHLALVEALRD